MRNKKIIILVFLGSIFLIYMAWVSFEKKYDSVVYVSIFDTIAVFPNNFTLDASSLSNEVIFKGESGSILVGKGNIAEENKDFISYIKNSNPNEGEQCGINQLISDELDIAVVYDSNNYMVLTGVGSELQRSIIQFLCINKT